MMRSFRSVLELSKSFPAFVVLFVNFSEAVKGKFSGLHEIARLEHKGHVRICNLERFLLWKHKFFVGIGVRAVWGHSWMQRGAARTKSLAFSVILPSNVTHKLSHTVSVIIRRLKSMLCYEPSWRKDHKIKSRSTALKHLYPSIADLTVRTVKIDGSGWS